MSRPKPVALIILDGFGIAPPGRGNAIALAKTPNLDRYASRYTSFLLQAAGEAVGAWWGEMGNSEIGHLNIGAGRIMYQDVQRINAAIANNSFFSNDAIGRVCTHVKETGGALHIVGLVSSGHVHASSDHYQAVLEYARRVGVARVFCHVFLDGRDAPYASGIDSLKTLVQKLHDGESGTIATVTGRWWAMDRDNHWDRIRDAYAAIVHGEATHTAEDPVAAVAKSYEQHVFDEEFPPTVMVRGGEVVGKMKEGDGIIFTNFRADRARQLAHALADPDFTRFNRGNHPKSLAFATMTQYDVKLSVLVAFPPLEIHNSFAEVVANHGLKQVHIAETEKYAHVTYFFNGGREEPFPGEQNTLVPSPSVPNYDQHPAMSAPAIKDRVLEIITARTCDVLVINFANADMVAHTGNLQATIKSVETLDLVIGQIIDVVTAEGGVAVVTADHGNAEGLLKMTGEIDKEHSAEPVPCIIVGNGFERNDGCENLQDLVRLKPAGVLADVAPTLLSILELVQPAEMTGRSLV